MPKVDTKDAKGARPAPSTSTTPMFGIEPNVAVMHQVVTAQLAARRAGTQSTKTRAEVRGRWRQALEAEGHRPSPRRLEPLADLDRRWRDPRPQAPQLRPAHPQEDDPPGAQVGAVRPGRLRPGAGPRLGPRRPEHQGRHRRPGRQRRRGQGPRGAAAPRTRRSGRACATSTTSTSAGPASSTPTTCSCPTGSSSRPTRCRSTARSPGAGTAAPPATEEALVKDPRDIIIAPIVSEKSYALSEGGAYTFKVHPSATKPEIHEAIEAIFGVQVLKVNTLNRKGEAEAQPPHLHLRQPPRHQAGDRHPRRGSVDRPLPGIDGKPLTWPFASASPPAPVAGSRRSPTSRRSPRTRPSAPCCARSTTPVAATTTAARPPATRAAATSSATASSTSSGTRTACRPRSPPSSTTRTATAASSSSTTSTARSATSSPRRT